MRLVLALLTLCLLAATARAASILPGQTNFTPQTAYTPTLVCGSGSVAGYTSQTGWYEQIDKLVFLYLDAQPSGAGTCSGTIVTNPPVAKKSGTFPSLSCIDVSTDAVIASAMLGSSLQLFTAAGGNPTAGDRIVCTGVYTQ